jgi:hypothetical protein
MEAKVRESVGSACIICRKYVDHIMKMSLQGGKKRVKWSGEREIVYNVHKFMQTVFQVGINPSFKSAE